MPPRKHVRLSPSGAHRWRNCPGSVRLEAEVGRPDTSSVHSREGTAAHDLAERCLNENLNPMEQIGQTIVVDGQAGDPEAEYEIEVTEEMAISVRLFVDYVRERAVELNGEVFVEVRVNLEDLDPPAPMGGTADAVIWSPSRRLLEVVDLKYGRGVVVEIEGNDQTRYYALGAVVELRKKPETVRTTIVQPRAQHADGPVRTASMSFQDLVEFKHRLFSDAEATQDPAAPLITGTWCRWCDALPVCPAQQVRALEVAQTEFDVLAEVEGDDESPLPTPKKLSVEQLVKILEASDVLETWLRSVRDYAQNRLERGLEVPGYKLVEGRSNRRWREDEEEAVDTFLRGKGLRVDERAPRKLISPYQAEKKLKAAGYDPGGSRRFHSLIHKPQGKPKMVREDHPKPALPPSAQEDFDALPESTS